MASISKQKPIAKINGKGQKTIALRAWSNKIHYLRPVKVFDFFGSK